MRKPYNQHEPAADERSSLTQSKEDTDGKRSYHQHDLLEIVELAVAGAEYDGEANVTLKTGPARKLLELAKKAQLPHGRPPLKGRTQVADAMVLQWAKSRKKQLVADGMRKEAAKRKAAEEAAAKYADRNLSAETIIRWME